MKAIFLLALLAAHPAPAEQALPQFARNVTLHVIAHEVAHAVIREFDLPLLGNEEDTADLFATIYIAQMLPDRAADIVGDRARSWQIEAAENPVDANQLMAEHAPDLRRAYRAICTLYGTDPGKYKTLAQDFGLTEDVADGCADSTPEIMRGWRRALAPVTMPPGQVSNEVRVIYGEGPLKETMMASGIMEQVADMIRRLDWHSQITLHFDHCDGGATWSRNGRTILLCDEYVMRFVDQAAIAP